MANEEQRRAFASYIRAGQASNGEATPNVYNVTTPVVFVPVSVPGFGDGRLTREQQFAALGAPPAAPTPPPAAPSSSASSYPTYPGVFPQAGFPQAGFGQAGFPQAGFPQTGFGPAAFGQAAFPQHPPPLGSPRMAQPQQHMPSEGGTSGYVPPTPTEFIAQGIMREQMDARFQYQYMNHMAESHRRQSGAPAGTVVPASQGARNVVEPSSRQTNAYYNQPQYGQPHGQQMPGPSIPPEEVPVPVMLCHTCSRCGTLRSAGFHRNNPVVPGQLLVASVCRKCNKSRRRRHRRRASSYTRRSSYVVDEPEDLPEESIRVEVNHSERRGRERSRTETYRSQYSPSPVRVYRRSSSHTRFGLRGMQQRPREYKTSTSARVSSLSPRRSSRYDGVWPPPDVVPPRSSRSEGIPRMPPGPSAGRASRPGEVWPPPDVVPTHSYRRMEREPIRRSSSRIIELNPSPPRARTRVTRVEVESEQRPRRRSESVSPIRVRVSSRERERRDDAEARISSHPRAYRQVVPEHRTDVQGTDETSSTHREPNSGPRVQFAPGLRDEDAIPERRTRAGYGEEERATDSDYEQCYSGYRRQRRGNDAPPEPLVEEFERIHIRRSSPSPRREYDEEIRIDRARRISPSPPPRRYQEDVRVRYVSPGGPRTRTIRPPSPERPTYTRINYAARAESPDPRVTRRFDRRNTVDDDETDSESGTSSGYTELRTWKGIDENGQPATFIEERRTDYGSGPSTRTWRDV